MANNEQIEYWNGEAGKRWAAYDANMALLLRPVTEALLEHAALAPGGRALDVGCGGGSQSLLLAEVLGPEAEVVGADISEPLLEVARRREHTADAAAMSFLRADASDHDFGQAQFDVLFSRFGVMFFDDPASAFANLRVALRSGGRVVFCCWRAPKLNDWTLIPLQAALKHVPPPPPQPPHAPGPFAFADPDYLQGILSDAGFENVDLHAHETLLSFARADTLAGNVRELATIGPIARLLSEQPPEVLEVVLGEIEQAVAALYDGQALNMPGSVWLVTATAP